jgi:transcription elongation factor Elf1
MATCISPRINGSLVCGGPIVDIAGGAEGLLHCATCRRRYTAEEMRFIERVNRYEETEAARKEQDRKTDRDARKAGPGKRVPA